MRNKNIKMSINRWVSRGGRAESVACRRRLQTLRRRSDDTVVDIFQFWPHVSRCAFVDEKCSEYGAKRFDYGYANAAVEIVFAYVPRLSVEGRELSGILDG